MKRKRAVLFLTIRLENLRKRQISVTSLVYRRKKVLKYRGRNDTILSQISQKSFGPYTMTSLARASGPAPVAPITSPISWPPSQQWYDTHHIHFSGHPIIYYLR